MSTQTASSQLKVTLPDQIITRLKSKSGKLGLKPATYIRHLVISDLEDDRDMLTYQMTPEREAFVLQQLEEHRQGKTHIIEDIDKFTASV